MANQRLLGPSPLVGANAEQNIQRRLEALQQLNSGVSRSYVNGRAVTLAAPKATEIYAEEQDEQFELVSYYTTRDQALIPLTARGAANGVATLGFDGIIPASQMPPMGSGFCKGPFGPSQVVDATTGSTRAKIASWNIGVHAFDFRPLVFMSVLVNGGVRSRPVIEVRIGTPSDTLWDQQTLVAQGFGRSSYNSHNTVTVLPTTHQLGNMQNGIQTSFPSSMNIQLTAWLYDAGGVSVNTTSGLFATASAWLMKVG